MDNPTRRLPDGPVPDSDNPTRRLPDLPPPHPADALPHDPLADYRLPAAPPVAAPPVGTAGGRPCLRCRTVLRSASVRTADRLDRRFLRTTGTSLRLAVGSRETPCSAWVCPACGYTELVADTPFALFGSAPSG